MGNASKPWMDLLESTKCVELSHAAIEAKGREHVPDDAQNDGHSEDQSFLEYNEYEDVCRAT